MLNENGTKKEMKNILTPGCRTTYLQSVSFHEIKQWCDDIVRTKENSVVLNQYDVRMGEKTK